MSYNVGCMDPTNVANPDYYHRVVDCQWACPAHTNVPEYIRLIAHGRFTEAYLLNRESNVFPGILGRTCDRPCEPACRRARVDGKPVAVDRLKALLDDGGFDAVFVGSGAPKGKELEIPGRHETDQIFIGIEWLESIHFGHVDSVGARVLIIGVGNTAMDCCRSAKRLGATDVKVIARKTRKYFKASAWELEDAEEEGVEIIENLQPVRFIVEDGKLTGMEFDRFQSIETDKGLKA